MLTLDARPVISEIPEISEIDTVAAFDWERDYGPLYRACPTAFWLAPESEGAMVRWDGPRLPTASPQIEPVNVLPGAVHGRSGAIVTAMLAAGPIFAAMLGMGAMGSPADGWWQPLGRAVASLVLMPFTLPVGAWLSALPIAIGVATLGHLGITRPTYRARWLWTGVGGAMGAAIAALFGAGGATGLMLMATSAACARIARISVGWTDPEPA